MTAPAARAVRLKADIQLEWTVPGVPADVPDADVIVRAWSALNALLEAEMSHPQNRADLNVDVRVAP